jgi:hypothetical protein
VAPVSVVPNLTVPENVGTTLPNASSAETTTDPKATSVSVALGTPVNARFATGPGETVMVGGEIIGAAVVVATTW